MSKRSIILIFTTVVVIVGIGGILYMSDGLVRDMSRDLGGDSDEYGCKTSAGYSWCGEKNKCIRTWEEPCESEQAVVGGDSDEHGCKGSAGYSWCEPKDKCLRVWEEQCYSSPEQEIRYALADKYGKNISDVTVSVRKLEGDYMSGGVSFNAPGLPEGGPGGVFLATKENSNAWFLVYSGNGSIDCAYIKGTYNFPPGMLTGFCD